MNNNLNICVLLNINVASANIITSNTSINNIYIYRNVCSSLCFFVFSSFLPLPRSLHRVYAKPRFASQRLRLAHEPVEEAWRARRLGPLPVGTLPELLRHALELLQTSLGGRRGRAPRFQLRFSPTQTETADADLRSTGGCPGRRPNK